MTAIPAMELPGGGRPMPVVGFGTASFPRALPEAVREAILHAIALGYRHFDTATLYGTERSLGDAISDALRRGLISSRDELFVTSKLWCTDNYADKVLPALQESLRNLQMEYLDLFLVHWPVSLHPIEGTTQPFDYGGVWGAMQECQRLGLAKSIGVSNFSCKKLEEILSLAKIPPAVNQVEMHPHWQQKKLMDFCKEKGILVTAYSPLGGNGILWGTKDVRECNTLKEIAAATEKTIAQVCLKWLFEQGIPFVVKSYNPERMKENLDIFDWELRTEDLQKISELPQNRGNERVGFVSPTGPYKTLEELWDGEV